MKFVILIVAAAFSTSALAAGLGDDAAKNDRLIVFTQPLKKPDGTVIQECVKQKPATEAQPAGCDKYEDVTLLTVSYAALSRPKQGQSMTEQASRWRLSRKIFNPATKISKPEATVIMTAISEAGFPVEYAGQSFCMLDPTFCDDPK